MRRVLLLMVSLIALVAGGTWTVRRVRAAAPSVQVQFRPENAQPRQLEDSTQASVLRDYKTAWQNLASAMEQNRPDLLDGSFVGFAHDKLGDAIAEQKSNGLHRRYIDHGHKVEAVFYSYDGSAMQLKDTASVEVQLLDGSKVVASEPATILYVVLMTPAENSWKIRDLEAVPSF
jgi:hypothetical protein